MGQFSVGVNRLASARMLRPSTGRRPGRRACLQPQMREDLLDHQLLKNRGHDLELTASLHRQRLLWSRQIEKSCDRTQSFAVVERTRLLSGFKVGGVDAIESATACISMTQLHRNYTFAPQKEKPASN